LIARGRGAHARTTAIRFTGESRRPVLRRARGHGDVVEEPAVVVRGAVGDRREADADAATGAAAVTTGDGVAHCVEIHFGVDEGRLHAREHGRARSPRRRAGVRDRSVVRRARDDRGARDERVVRAIQRNGERTAVEAALVAASVTELHACLRRPRGHGDASCAIRLREIEVVRRIVGAARGAAALASLPLVNKTNVDDPNTLLAERGRELYWESVRRTDLLRFGVFNVIWQYKPTDDSHYNVFPIPAQALASNPNLKQNPGYAN